MLIRIIILKFNTLEIESQYEQYQACVEIESQRILKPTVLIKHESWHQSQSQSSFGYKSRI